MKYPKLAHTKETRTKISKALKGKRRSKETRARMSAARYKYLNTLEKSR